jgi:major type 1 subunit fimbrin (pilin)
MLEMKRSLPIALALSMALGLAATAASASNTITINGGISTTTCTVKGEQGLDAAGGAADFTVKLPVLTANQFNAPGATAGKVPFTIGLSNCTIGDQGSVAAYFHPALSDINMAAGTLKNKSTTTPSNIEVQLLDGQDSDSEINLGSYKATKAVTIDTATNSAKMLFWVQYRAPVAAITPGEYSSSLQYDIDYQ